jgi:exo beta-1,2-glucooligosaccharide sophorohydrolase (non-reducing end)
MTARLVTILFALAVTGALPSSRAAADYNYDKHVVFDHSRGDRSYYHSEAKVVAPSRFEIVKGKLPVESEECMTAPNCLRLRWRSQDGGSWEASIKTQKHWGSAFPEGDTLSFWVRSEEGLNEESSPQILLVDEAGKGNAAIRLLDKGRTLPAGKWVRMQMRFTDFVGIIRDTSDEVFNPKRVAAIRIVQGLDDGKQHTLLLDEIEVTSSRRDDGRPPGAPSSVAATGSDRHVDLSWRPPVVDGVRHYTIYRSTDGKRFRPVGTQKPHINRYVDFLGKSGRKVWYRVSAVDHQFRESTHSATAAAETRALSDDELLTMVQRACFRYYWEGAHPVAGMALEVIPGDPNLVALGASGFGIMAMIVAAERGFISREQAVQRMVRIVRFLDRADRFHGVWPHYLHGRTGKTIAHFGKYDDGADLVETAFVMQGLLAARQYYSGDTPGERELRATITKFWRTVEWDWFARGPDKNFLYWHWSPRHGFHIRHPLIGWNETMIVYLLGVASPTHAIPAQMFHTGWAGQSETAVRYRQGWRGSTDGDNYTNGKNYYGIRLEVGVPSELFFTQFSFMGFDPRNLRDRYTNYFSNNRAMALIHRAYAIDNPRRRDGYGDQMWGFSAGIHGGGGKPTARDDNGTVHPHAALGAFPYTPRESMKVLKHMYRDLGDKLWGLYGFYDAINETEEWYEDVNMGLDQAPIVVMIENHRTGLVWKHFMATPEIDPALRAIGFWPDDAPQRASK